MYKIYRKELGKKICLCSQDFEDKEQFKAICSVADYEIYLDNKNVTSKYKSKTNKKEK